MNVLFIGGTGRLSKDVAKATVEKGNKVFLLTRGSEYRSRFVNEKCSMLIGDIRKPESCKKYFEKPMYYDVIIDFLSLCEADIKRTLELIEGTYKQYIFVSSATVYTRNENVITEDNGNIGNSRWEYAYNKYLCEEYLKNYFSEKEDESFYTIIRPYVTYGNTRVPYPLVPRNTILEYSFIQRIINGQAIPTFDNGATITAILNTKDFSYLVVGLFGNDKAKNEDFNIADEEITRWREVIDIIGELLNTKVVTSDYSKDEICKYMPEYEPVLYGDKGIDVRFDITKVKKVVGGYKKTVSLKEGLLEMISYYQENPELQLIDYKWNGKIDRLLYKKGMNSNYKYRFPTLKAASLYYSGRYSFVGKIMDMVIKIISVI
ncbi:MAG: NAD-dependent epimerase/dehydratase family protein [Lachnospiraceae bacterium]|nr:NAD-dependent epimerase/dehydratase family protein [Lachnospiraceae bacterium]